MSNHISISRGVPCLYLFVVEELDAAPVHGHGGDPRPDPEDGHHVEGHVLRLVTAVLHDRPQIGRPVAAEGDVVEGARRLVGVDAVAVVPVELARGGALGVEVDAEEEGQFSTARSG